MNKQIISFVDDLINHHADYDRFSERYDLAYSDLNSFDIDNLCSLMLAHDKDLACEATGADNALYLKTMLPSLIDFLKLDDKDAVHHFADEWRKGISTYLKKMIESLIEDRLAFFNDSRRQPSHSIHPSSMRIGA